MKTKSVNFYKLCSVVSIIATLGLVMPAAHAVIDNTGCDNEDNLYITPELALCSTHVYNIGLIDNPSNSMHKQMTQDVVALKTTLITQQMYSQYEILETTVRRLRTLLEKEVLMARMRAATGETSGSSSSSSSSGGGAGGNDKYVKLNGAENCLDRYSGEKDVLNCELRNLDRISASAASNTSDAKKQLNITLENIAIYIEDVEKANLASKFGTCLDNASGNKRDNIIDCCRKVKATVGRHLDNLSNTNNSQRNNQQANR